MNEDGSLNSKSNPAAAGSEVVLFATGVGMNLSAAVVFLSDDGDAAKIPASDISASSLPGLFPVKVKLPDINGRSWSVRLAMGADALSPLMWLREP